MVSKTLNDRFTAKLTGVTYRPGLSIVGRLFPVFVGFAFGAFFMVVLLRPDLINWQAFSQSFMLGIIMGMR